jgi:hypothetical protein
MFVKRNAIRLCVGMAGAVLLSSSVSRAKTVTVQNLSQDPTTGVYQYSILFDSGTYLKPGDGFVIYGFAGMTGWSLGGTGSSGSISSSGNGTTSIGPISLTQSMPSNGLTDENAATIADADAAIVATDNGMTLSTTTENLSFVWVGLPKDYTGSATATLTIETSVTGSEAVGIYASVDRSGNFPSSSYGTAEGTLFVPGPEINTVPEPVTIGSMMVLGSLGMLKRRRRA